MWCHAVDCIDHLGEAAGMGPDGYLRFPSSPAERWTFPGIGEFQCYDKYILSTLQAAALEMGREEDGQSGPHDAGTYCQWPHQTRFFRCVTVIGPPHALEHAHKVPLGFPQHHLRVAPGC